MGGWGGTLGRSPQPHGASLRLLLSQTDPLRPASPARLQPPWQSQPEVTTSKQHDEEETRQTGKHAVTPRAAIAWVLALPLPLTPLTPPRPVALPLPRSLPHRGRPQFDVVRSKLRAVSSEGEWDSQRKHDQAPDQ